MEKQQSEWIVIKLGGSILVPDLPDAEYLKSFREVILKYVEEGKKFLIIVGGGKTARHYMGVLGELGRVGVPQDWMGVHSGRLNAQLVRLAFGDEYVYPEIKNFPSEMPELSSITQPIIIGGSGKPGHSFNLGAVNFAEYVGARQIINLSNIDFVYSADPRENPDAVPYPEVDWDTYLTFIPDEWEPGLSTPFDLVASADAKKLGISVIFMKGTELDSFRKFLNGESFLGTTIHP